VYTCQCSFSSFQELLDIHAPSKSRRTYVLISARQGAPPKKGLLQPRSGHDACGRIRLPGVCTQNRSCPRCIRFTESSLPLEMSPACDEFGYICHWRATASGHLPLPSVLLSLLRFPPFSTCHPFSSFGLDLLTCKRTS
jgi:hypothetical protein